MRVFSLTATGRSLAANPSDDRSDARMLLYWVRRRGGAASDEHVKDYFGGDAMKARLVINALTRADANHTPALMEISSR